MGNVGGEAPVRVDMEALARALEDKEDDEDGLYRAGDRYMASDKAMDIFVDGLLAAEDRAEAERVARELAENAGPAVNSVTLMADDRAA